MVETTAGKRTVLLTVSSKMTVLLTVPSKMSDWDKLMMKRHLDNYGVSGHLGDPGPKGVDGSYYPPGKTEDIYEDPTQPKSPNLILNDRYKKGKQSRRGKQRRKSW